MIRLRIRGRSPMRYIANGEVFSIFGGWGWWFLPLPAAIQRASGRPNAAWGVMSGTARSLQSILVLGKRDTMTGHCRMPVRLLTIRR